MPFPNQTNQQTIIETAAQLIEAEGVEQLSLGKLAKAVGIKAPSLYRHVKNKDKVLDLVTQLTYTNLFERYAEALAAGNDDPVQQCLRVAKAHRRFALKTPNLYMLAFSRKQPDIDPQEDLLFKEAVKLQKIIAQFAGEAEALTALRGLLALIHGFASLEINQQYRRGGNLDEAFTHAVKQYVEGWR